MLIAELIGKRQFRLVDQPVKDPGPGEVQVRVDAVGVCGSDVHNYAEGAVGDTPCQYPQVIGHEPAGTVVKRGSGVTGWQPGDRAALEPAMYCYHCEFCRTGHHNVCANLRFMSTPGDPGFFREFVNIPAGNLLAVPGHISMSLATVVEPLAVTVHSVKLARIEPGENVAVFGAGPIGLLTIAALKAVGVGRIWAVEPVAHRREMAKYMGADAVVDPGAADAAREILADTGGRGVDCSIDCATKQDTTNQAIRAARNAGRVAITGIHSETHVPFEVSPLRRKELTIYNVRRSNHDSQEALDLIVQRPELFEPMLTHTREMTKIAEAFAIAESYADGVVKMVVVP